MHIKYIDGVSIDFFQCVFRNHESFFFHLKKLLLLLLQVLINHRRKEIFDHFK